MAEIILPALPEPDLETNGDVFGHENVHGYTAATVRSLLEQTARATLEQAAKVGNCAATFDAWMLKRFGPELSGVSPMVHEQLLEAWQFATAAERARCEHIASEEADDQESCAGSDAAGAARNIESAIRGIQAKEGES